MPVATYTSVWDDDIVCESQCEFDEDTLICSCIELADNAEDADYADAMTDEFVTIDGIDYGEHAGIIFHY